MNLCAALSHMDRGTKEPLRVLLIDADPQSNSSCYMLGQDYWRQHIYNQSAKTLYGLFERALRKPESALDKKDIIGGDARSPIFQSGRLSWENLFLFPSHYDLALIENKIKIDKSGRIKVAGELIFPYQLMSLALKPIEQEYDFIIIDCPPNIYNVAQNALFYADFIVVPVVPDWLSTQGLAWLLKSLESLFSSFQQKTKTVKRIVPMNWKEINVHRNSKESIGHSLYEEWKRDASIKKIIKNCEIWPGLKNSSRVLEMVELCRPLIDLNSNEKNQIMKMAEDMSKWPVPRG